MADQPTLSPTGQRLYDKLGSLSGPDDENGYALAIVADALAAPFGPVADLVSEREDGTPGWAAHLFDPDGEPAEWLPATEVFQGVNPYPAVDQPGRRLRIKQTDGRFRGTPGAIKGGARQFLIGPDGTPESATVYLTVRVGGVATDYTVATLASETPNPDLVEAALLEQQPAGYNKTAGHAAFVVIAGGDWQTLVAVHADWADVANDFATWDDVIADPSVT